MLKKKLRVLVINPTTTLTKLALFDQSHCILMKQVVHQLKSIPLVEQLEIRQTDILDQLDKEGINLSHLDAICGRGGLVRAISGGTYQVNQSMLNDLKIGYHGDHPSNLGGRLAYAIANDLNIPSFIVDPVVVDELQPLARYSGIPTIQRKSIFHALNHKATARQAAKDLGLSYHDANFIIVHMADGITVGAHYRGKVIDVNNGLHGDGPFSPERAGTIPAADLIDLCFSGNVEKDTLKKRMVGYGGLYAYLQTKDTIEIEARIQAEDTEAKIVYEAMAYQVAKEIGAMSVVLSGNINAIILTGPLAEGAGLVSKIKERIDWIADVHVYPGENEMHSLAKGAFRVLTGEEQVNVY